MHAPHFLSTGSSLLINRECFMSYIKPPRQEQGAGISTRGRCFMIPTLTLCSLDRLFGMVDVYNYIIRVVINIFTFIYLCKM